MRRCLVLRKGRSLHSHILQVRSQEPEVRRVTRRNPFVDKVKALVTSGRGGDGRSCFLHEYQREFGGPSGGNGGKGGNVFLVATHKRQDLAHIDAMGYHIFAGPGNHGMAKNKWGGKGEDLCLEVPLGTVILDVDSNVVVHDLEAECGVVLLEGGAGGKGNMVFKHATNQSPKEATRGIPGSSMLVQFELKTIADVGLVGYPNAGKSSVLCATTTSKPKVAPWAFTTQQAYVGQLHNALGEMMSMADLPGLVEGAYANRGLGHQFLRHVERTKCLCYVLDMTDPFQLDRPQPQQPWEVLHSLQMELEYYSPGLSERAVMVLANKMDVPQDAEGVSTTQKLEELRARTHLPVYPISALHGEGLHEAMTALFPLVVERKDLLSSKREKDAAAVRDESYQRHQRRQEWVKGRDLEVKESLEAEGFFQEEKEEACSLVDMQLDAAFGDSGVTRLNIGTMYAPAESKLHTIRDESFEGRYWRLTRESEERLPDEVMSAPRRQKKK